jgi:preprotein translocase subunit SecF
MEFFNHNTHFDFMGQRTHAMIFSMAIFVLSSISMLSFGLNLGLDFTGGTQIEIHYPTSVNLPHIRSQFHNHGFKKSIIQTYGTSKDIMVRLAPKAHLNEKQLRAQITKFLAPGTIERLEYIGPQVGKTLVTNGILSVIVALIATMIYIAMRFDYRFAVSAALSLIHDPVLILGIFSWLQLEFNLISLAALLTILGYSLNDTIVVYDRVRENFRKDKKSSPTTILNQSINQTLSRTIMTSSLTLVVVLSLCIFGGEALRGFSIALIVGIVIGTYSSIYVAGSLALALGLNQKVFLEKPRYQDHLP